jgi:hypothetical protein
MLTMINFGSRGVRVLGVGFFHVAQTVLSMPGARQRNAKNQTLDEQSRSRSRSRTRSKPRAPRGGAKQRLSASSSSGLVRVADAGAESVNAPRADNSDDSEFRTHIATMYLRNQLSAKETADLVRKAQHAGASGVVDLAKAGNKPGQRNEQRTLLRALTKGKQMPNAYFAEIPVAELPGSRVK